MELLLLGTHSFPCYVPLNSFQVKASHLSSTGATIANVLREKIIKFFWHVLFVNVLNPTARWLVRSAFVKQQGYASCTSTITFNYAQKKLGADLIKPQYWKRAFLTIGCKTNNLRVVVSLHELLEFLKQKKDFEKQQNSMAKWTNFMFKGTIYY